MNPPGYLDPGMKASQCGNERQGDLAGRNPEEGKVRKKLGLVVLKNDSLTCSFKPISASYRSNAILHLTRHRSHSDRSIWPISYHCWFD